MFGCSVQRRHACFVPPLVVNYLIVFVQMVLAVFKLSEITQKSIKKSSDEYCYGSLATKKRRAGPAGCGVDVSRTVS